MEADLVITNGKVITVDKDFSIKQAVAVQDGKIVAVGTNDEFKGFVGTNTRVLDLKGKPILPGPRWHAARFDSPWSARTLSFQSDYHAVLDLFYRE